MRRAAFYGVVALGGPWAINLAVASSLGNGSAYAYDATLAIVRGLPNPTEQIWKQDHSGFAIQGFDPVSYFMGEPRPGKPAYEVVWSGVAWRFASAANRSAFLAAPMVYAPEFGGYDATLVAKGIPVDADPSIYLIRDDRLYMFRTMESRAAFAALGTVSASRDGWRDARMLLVRR